MINCKIKIILNQSQRDILWNPKLICLHQARNIKFSQNLFIFFFQLFGSWSEITNICYLHIDTITGLMSCTEIIISTLPACEEAGFDHNKSGSLSKRIVIYHYVKIFTNNTPPLCLWAPIDWNKCFGKFLVDACTLCW